jgi:hypothetical protein
MALWAATRSRSRSPGHPVRCVRRTLSVLAFRQVRWANAEPAKSLCHRIGLCCFRYSKETQNAKMSTELKSTGLGGTSPALKHVFPPAVLGSLQNDVLLVWNSAFQKTVGLSQDELARTPLTSVLILEENQRNPILRDHDAERDNQLLPCALRNSLTNVRGQALRCDDGMLLAMLDVTLGDLVSVGFNQGRRMGCEEERNRTRHFFHHVLELQNTCSLLSGARDSSKASRKRSRRSWKHG